MFHKILKYFLGTPCLCIYHYNTIEYWITKSTLIESLILRICVLQFIYLFIFLFRISSLIFCNFLMKCMKFHQITKVTFNICALKWMVYKLVLFIFSYVIIINLWLIIIILIFLLNFIIRCLYWIIRIISDYFFKIIFLYYIWWCCHCY